MYKKKIAIFGHYGNRNLGDEAIIEAMVSNLRQRLPESEFVCISIDPVDSAYRHRVESFPIRLRRGVKNTPVGPEEAATIYSSQSARSPVHLPKTDRTAINNIKQTLRSIPVLGSALRFLVRLWEKLSSFRSEVAFLNSARNYVKTLDMIFVTGSNQFLDNFGGAWGFPYTLLKWSVLAKASGVKVAFVSVGAGPLTGYLSFKFLSFALRSCVYLSYRDEGSKALVESHIKVDGKIYPDLAHSLKCDDFPAGNKSGKLTIGINPMPVYDGRYWPVDRPDKYKDYVVKLSQACTELLKQGHRVILFGTQTRDADVTVDILELLSSNNHYESWQNHIDVVDSKNVSELMQTIAKTDFVIATRFHATVLPLILGIPVLGICYYRKAEELLDDVGLQDFHVDIDRFSSDEILEKLNKMTVSYRSLGEDVTRRHVGYRKALNLQYDILAKLVESD